MRQHSALLELPAELTARGVPYVALGRESDLYRGEHDWSTAQGDYLYRDPATRLRESESYDRAASALIIHGTAGTAATVQIRTSGGTWQYYNAWLGLYRGGSLVTPRLYSSGDGDPLLVLVASGPARWGAGDNHWPTLEAYPFIDEACEAPPTISPALGDTNAGNRYTWNVSVVHPNDGSPWAPGIEEVVTELGVVWHEVLGYRDRTVFHRTITKRKPVDPYWTQPADVGLIRVREAIRDRTGGMSRASQWPIEGYGGVLDEEVGWLGSASQRMSVEFYSMRIVQLITGEVYDPDDDELGRSTEWLDQIGNPALLELDLPPVTPFLWDPNLTTLLRVLLPWAGGGIGEREDVALRNRWSTRFPGRIW